MYQTAVLLGRAGEADEHAGRDAPLPDPERRARLVARPEHHRLGQPRAGDVPVDDERAERGEHEEHQEDVEDAGPAEHELEAVERQQQPGRAAEQRGPGQPARDPAHDEDGQRPEERGRDPPAERGQPVEPLADRDEQLADRRLDHVLAAAGAGAAWKMLVVPGDDQVVDVVGVVRGVGDPVPLDPVLEDRPGVLGVVRLVEDDRVGNR